MLDMQEEKQTHNTEKLQTFVNRWPTYHIVHRIFNLIIPNFCEQLEAYLKECIQVSKHLSKSNLDAFKSHLIEPKSDHTPLVITYLDSAYQKIAQKYPALHRTISKHFLSYTSTLSILQDGALKHHVSSTCSQLEHIRSNTRDRFYSMFAPLLCEPRYDIQEFFLPLPFLSALFAEFLRGHIEYFVQAPSQQLLQPFSLEDLESAKSLFDLQKQYYFELENIVIQLAFSKRPADSSGDLTAVDILAILEKSRVRAEPVTVEINNIIHNALISTAPHFPNVLRDLVIQYHNSLPEIHNPVVNSVPHLIHGALINIKPEFPKALSRLVVQYYCPEIPNVGSLLMHMVALITHLVGGVPIQDSPEFRKSIDLIFIRCQEFRFGSPPILFFQIDNLLDILAYAQHGIRKLPFPSSFIEKAYNVFHWFQSCIHKVINIPGFVSYQGPNFFPHIIQRLSRIIFDYSCEPKACKDLEAFSLDFKAALQRELINQSPNWAFRLLAKASMLQKALIKRLSAEIEEAKETHQHDGATLAQIDTTQRLETELADNVDMFLSTLESMVQDKLIAHYPTAGESKRTTNDAPLFSAEFLENTRLMPLRAEVKAPDVLTPMNVTAENPSTSETHTDQAADTTASSSSAHTKRKILSASQDTTSAEWIANKKARPPQDNPVDPAHLASIWAERRVLTAPTEHNAAPASADASAPLSSQATPDSNSAPQLN